MKDYGSNFFLINAHQVEEAAMGFIYRKPKMLSADKKGQTPTSGGLRSPHLNDSLVPNVTPPPYHERVWERDYINGFHVEPEASSTTRARERNLDRRLQPEPSPGPSGSKRWGG